MKALDHVLQRWRIEAARPYIQPGARVLDIGCSDGILFRLLRSRIREGIGIDPLAGDREDGRYRIIHGVFPDAVPSDAPPFDVITMLAVVEHIPAQDLPRIARSCASLLRPAGRLVMTIPSPAVDRILHVLTRIRLMDGMEVHQHYGFDVRRTPDIFAELAPVTARRFEFGLNNLFVFEKRG